MSECVHRACIACEGRIGVRTMPVERYRKPRLRRHLLFVYRLYGLTDEEIAVVGGVTPNDLKHPDLERRY